MEFKYEFYPKEKSYKSPVKVHGEKADKLLEHMRQTPLGQRIMNARLERSKL